MPIVNKDFYDFCDGCPMIDPVADKTVLYANNEAYTTAISLTCSNKRLCGKLSKILPGRMKLYTLNEVCSALIMYGKQDARLTPGEAIRYSPSEIRSILEEQLSPRK